jgi:hypothetical protein
MLPLCGLLTPDYFLLLLAVDYSTFIPVKRTCDLSRSIHDASRSDVKGHINVIATNSTLRTCYFIKGPLSSSAYSHPAYHSLELCWGVLHCVRSEVLTAVNVKITLYWSVTLRNVIEVYQSSEGSWCPQPHPDGGGSRFIRNVGNFVLEYSQSHCRRHWPSVFYWLNKLEYFEACWASSSLAWSRSFDGCGIKFGGSLSYWPNR